MRCAESAAGTRPQCATMIERACRTLYVLAELLCVIGLLALCVLKVQHFLSQPVSTAVSYQPSRHPAITICNQLIDELAVMRLKGEFWDDSTDLWRHSSDAFLMLGKAKKVVGVYWENEKDQDNPTIVTSDNDLKDKLHNITKNMLKRVLNETEEVYQRLLGSDHVYDYSEMNETQSQLADVLKESIVTIQHAAEAVRLSDLQTVNVTLEALDRLVNASEELELRLRLTYEWNSPTPERLLTEGTRRVDQFVISCRRGNSSCMPGEGGVWQLRHVLQTKEKCYTLLAPEEEVSDDGSSVVIELRGSRWREEIAEQRPNSAPLPPGFSPNDSADEAVQRPNSAPLPPGFSPNDSADEAEQRPNPAPLPPGFSPNDSADETEQRPNPAPLPPGFSPNDSADEVDDAIAETTSESMTTTSASMTTTSESMTPETDSTSTQEPTFYPAGDYDNTTYVLPPDNTTYDELSTKILPPINVTSQANMRPPTYLKSFNNFQGAADAIQYVTYKVLLHAAPVPLLNTPGGLHERSFEIFNNQDWVEVDVRMEELRSLNRKSRPCEEDPAYSRGSCLSECQAAAHARAAGCQLETVWPATAQGLPQCETADQMERLRAELETPPSCDCPRSCRQGRVSAVVQASSRTDIDHNVTLTVRLDGDMQVIEESVAYTFGSLLTDFGGNMGLTMGFSLLTIVELLKKITFGFFEKDKVENVAEGKVDTWADYIA